MKEQSQVRHMREGVARFETEKSSLSSSYRTEVMATIVKVKKVGET